MKMLTVADQEGALPAKHDGSARTFDPVAYATYMADNCQFAKYLKPCLATNEALAELKVG